MALTRSHRLSAAVIGALAAVVLLPVWSASAADDPSELLATIKAVEEFEAAQSAFERLQAGYPDADETIQAMWWMVQWYEQVGDEDEAGRLWQRLESLPADQEHVEIRFKAEMHVKNIPWLRARHFEAVGDWEEALAWWRQAKAFGWCGTGTMAMAIERNLHIALCELRLGRDDDALATLDEAIFCPDYWEFGMEAAVIWAWLQQQRGTLDAAYERLWAAGMDREFRSGVRAVQQYLEMVDMRDRGDAAGLFALLAWDDPFDQSVGVEPRLVFKLLLTIPKEAEAAAREFEKSDTPRTARWARVLLRNLASPRDVVRGLDLDLPLLEPGSRPLRGVALIWRNR